MFNKFDLIFADKNTPCKNLNLFFKMTLLSKNGEFLSFSVCFLKLFSLFSSNYKNIYYFFVGERNVEVERRKYSRVISKAHISKV